MLAIRWYALFTEPMQAPAPAALAAPLEAPVSTSASDRGLKSVATSSPSMGKAQVGLVSDWPRPVILRRYPILFYFILSASVLLRSTRPPAWGCGCGSGSGSGSGCVRVGVWVGVWVWVWV